MNPSGCSSSSSSSPSSSRLLRPPCQEIGSDDPGVRVYEDVPEIR
jgi:hypothetical protein